MVPPKQRQQHNNNNNNSSGGGGSLNNRPNQQPRPAEGVACRLFSRPVCFAHQQTTVFKGAPAASGPAAVILGNIDNDLKGEIEVAVGGVDGTLAVFKAAHPSAGPYLTASGAMCDTMGHCCCTAVLLLTALNVFNEGGKQICAYR